MTNMRYVYNHLSNTERRIGDMGNLDEDEKHLQMQKRYMSGIRMKGSLFSLLAV